jgi:hypothetical protein
MHEKTPRLDPHRNDHSVKGFRQAVTPRYERVCEEKDSTGLKVTQERTPLYGRIYIGISVTVLLDYWGEFKNL